MIKCYSNIIHFFFLQNILGKPRVRKLSAKLQDVQADLPKKSKSKKSKKQVKQEEETVDTENSVQLKDLHEEMEKVNTLGISFRFSRLLDLVADEVALEGLEGITLEGLY